MRLLLSKRDLRHLEFLELLMNEEQISLSRASKKTGYSVRTLSADITKINEYLTSAYIETGADGIALIIPANSSIRQVYTDILKQSREYNLLEYLFFNSGKNKEEIAELLHISTSTFSRMVKQMNGMLTERQITILPGPYRVEGDEMMISQVYIALFSELYSDGHSLMKPEEWDVLLTMYENVAGQRHIELNYPDVIRISIWIFVRIYRIKAGFHSSYRKETEEAEDKILNDTAFCNRFETSFGLKLSNEVLFEAYRMFFRPGFAREHSDMKEITDRMPNLGELYVKINLLVENVAKNLGISCANTENLKRNLFNLVQLPLNPPYILYSKYKIFAEGFWSEHQKVGLFIRTMIERTFSDLISEDIADVVFYILVTQWPRLIQELEANSPEIAVGVFCDSDIAHAQIICEVIRKYSNIKLKVLIPNVINDLDNLCQGVDLIITNIPVLKVPCNEIICIQEYPTARDWQNIILAQKRIYDKKMHLNEVYSEI